MKNGLKGVTDATVFCKSMKKGNEKNQMMRLMKSYEVGGVTGLSSPAIMSAESECQGGPGGPGCRGSRTKVRQSKYLKRRRVPGMH